MISLPFSYSQFSSVNYQSINILFKHVLGRIQDLVKGDSDKRPPTLSNCYCCLTSPFFTGKSMVKIFAFISF